MLMANKGLGSFADASTAGSVTIVKGRAEGNMDLKRLFGRGRSSRRSSAAAGYGQPEMRSEGPLASALGMFGALRDVGRRLAGKDLAGKDVAGQGSTAHDTTAHNITSSTPQPVYDPARSAVRDDQMYRTDSRVAPEVIRAPMALGTGEGWLTAREVQKSFRARRVVQGASLSVRRGEAVGLLGPNGAGKTTIFYMITGLIIPEGGRIELDGQDITSLPMYQRARLGIGYLPQEASIFRGLTVEENIRAVLEVVEPDRRKREHQLDALLEEFHITHIRKSPSIALSGGERRRCEIARALAGRPAFMLLDEPFAGIDPIAVGDIQTLVRHLTERGIGVLITDHNVRETLGLIDRAYIIHSGRVLMEGTPEEIVNNPDVRRLYLGEQFTM
jgi:lipopolysaccharide export system ATP-binding protein